MKRYLNDLRLRAIRTDQRYLRLLLVAVTVGLFVVGAGAPDSFGGPGG